MVVLTPNADDDNDFTSVVGGRWFATDPTLDAPDPTNMEYVHQSLALQAIIDDRSWIIDDDDSPIDRWLSKRSLEEREELLHICMRVPSGSREQLRHYYQLHH
jgi:hypothetical protein